MEIPSRPDECWSIFASDQELDMHLVGIEGYSNLSDDNLNTILRSFTENLQQKKSHLNHVWTKRTPLLGLDNPQKGFVKY